jgi:hypothetical protein
MKRHSIYWLLGLSSLAVLWQDCGENFALFCYRIGWGTFSNLRRSLVPIPISSRPSKLCWNSSATSSIPYMTSKE